MSVGLDLPNPQAGKSENDERLRRALDKVTAANIMIADADGVVVYLNEAVVEMFRNAEDDIRREIAGFRADGILGRNFDDFHRDPSHQRGLLRHLSQPYRSQIEIGGWTFALIATPIFSAAGDRTGTVVEWSDR